jgi:hypothetical protein
MTQQESDVSPAIERGTPAFRRVANLAAHLVGAAGLALGAASTLAKRRRNKSDGDSEVDRETRREERANARREDRENGGQDDKREARQDRHDARQEDNHRDNQARNGSVDQEQRASRKKDDEPDNSDDEDTNDDDGGGNDRGNAGSGFFDNPLARKTQRRANDFENNRNRDDEPDEDRLSADTDDNSQNFETNSISFTSGPDGLEVVTRNIEFSAPPTPTPTPFPTLTLPERDRLDVFGDRVIAAPTAAPSDNDTASEPARPPSTDTGTSVSTGSRPTPAPPASDTSGGDNTSDFLS